MGECENRSAEVDRLHLIDVSSEDDCLIASPSTSSVGDHQASGFLTDGKGQNSFESYEAGNSWNKDSIDIIERKEQVAASFDSHEPERPRKTDKLNLRKSLAWDSAFFTSAGVLEPEELTIVNNGFKKVDLRFLPGIEEDMRRSAESNSTLDSDSLTLESLEINLFEDVRASIQRSSKTFNLACSTGKAGLKKTSMENIHTLKKSDNASKNMAKPICASKRQITGKQVTERMKEASVRPCSGQPVARAGVSNSSSLKPPKISIRANPIAAETTKRASLAANHVKMQSTTAKPINGFTALASKKPRSRYTSTFAPSSGSSSGSPVAAKGESTDSCSSFNSSGRTSSDASVKSPLSSTRRKIDSRNVNLSLSGSNVKSQKSLSSRKKVGSENHCLSTYLTSMSKISSSISPATSIDGWSSESSSSTSTMHQRSYCSKASFDTNSSCGITLDIDADQQSIHQNHQPDQLCVGPESEGTSLPNQHVKKTCTATGTLPNPASTNVSQSSKPSGLRMPSPKIGFFDAEKHAPNGNLQCPPGVRNGLHKVGAGVSNVKRGTSNLKKGTYKTNSGKLQLGRTVVGSTNIKHDSPQTGVQRTAPNIRPISVPQLRELSDASPKVFGTSRATKNSPTSSVSAGNKPSPTSSRANHSKVMQVEVKGFDAANHGMCSNGQGDLMMELSPIKDSPDFHWDASFAFDCENVEPSKRGAKEVIYEQHNDNTEINSRSLESSEKENLHHSKDQINDLSSQVEAMDLNRNPLKELTGKKGSSECSAASNTGSVDRESVSSFSSKALVHCHEDFVEVSAGSVQVSLSPPIDQLYNFSR